VPRHSRPKSTFGSILQTGRRVNGKAETADHRISWVNGKEKRAQPPGSWCWGLHLQQTILPCAHQGLRSIGSPQLREEIGDMLLHGHQLDDQLRGDLLYTSAPPAFPERAAALMVCRSFPRPTRRAMTPSSVVCFSHMLRCSGLSKRTVYGECNPFAYRHVERHGNRSTPPRCALPTTRDGRLHHFCSHILIQGNNRGVSNR